MYKIIQRNGIEVESGFEDLVDALDRLRQIKRLGTGQVFVVDVSTTIKIMNKRLDSKQNNRNLSHFTDSGAHVSYFQTLIVQLLIFSFRKNHIEKKLTAQPTSSRLLWNS